MREITYTVPRYMYERFFMRQDKSLGFYFVSEKRRLEKKLFWLCKKKMDREVSEIESIKYHVSVMENARSPRMNLRSQRNNFENNKLKVKFSRDILVNNPPHSTVFTINLDPNNFSSMIEETTILNEKWFKNLTNIEIPLDVQHIL